jgi:deoxyribodipyrimidine photo-lyase
LGLLPRRPDWAAGWTDVWRPGEAGARTALDSFMAKALAAYATDRNLPGVPGSSVLSPHLRFGEISPTQVVAAIEASTAPATHESALKFRQELVWRDFCYNLLFHFPHLPSKEFNPKFENFPWADPDPAVLHAWQRGRTGYPIVDAGMRQLWQTGFMHNRVRMITASFLTKHLLADWRLGEAWFWDTLVDADAANNAVNWQWVAGCGPDAAPYFRIFNPVLQGEKFDPEGTYVRRFVPELDRLEIRFLHRPWEAPPGVLAKAGLKLGTTYPAPIIDHEAARARALAALARLRDTPAEAG